MYSGWLRRFQVDRLIRREEEVARLKTAADPSVVPDDRLCAAAINSTYMDVVDRRFRLRGMISTSMTLFGVLLLWAIAGWLLFAIVLPVFAWRVVDFVLLATVAVASFGQTLLFWRVMLRHDFFTWRWYPIRFNRRTRQVHFFRGEEGELTVPWDDAYFHIGHGLDQTFLRDVRMHVMEGDVVRKTQAIGHYYDNDDAIRMIWEFIRTYMEEGPEGLRARSPIRHIRLSVASTWENCYMAAMGSLGKRLIPLRFLLMPVMLPMVACRWLVMRSCQEPVFSAEVIASSTVDRNDPGQWPEPTWMGQLDVDALLGEAERRV